MSASFARADAMRIILILLVAVPVSAQTEVETPAPSFTGATGLFFAIDSKTVPRGVLTLGFSAANFDQLYPEAPELRPDSDRPFRGFDVDRGEFRLFATWGLAERWEVSAVLPYIHYNQNIGDVAGFVEGLPRIGEFTDHGVGDLAISTKMRFIDSDDYAVAGSVALEIPTGETEGGLASGDWGWRAGLHADVSSLTVSAVYRRRGQRDAGDTPLGASFDLADQILLDAGWEHRLGRWDRTLIIGELNGLMFSGGDRAADDQLYATAGLRHRWRGSCWTTDVAVNYNVTMAASDNPSHPIGGLLSVSCSM